jgi:hypothetical protein
MRLKSLKTYSSLRRHPPHDVGSIIIHNIYRPSRQAYILGIEVGTMLDQSVSGPEMELLLIKAKRENEQHYDHRPRPRTRYRI